jgi:hypothetical protein
MLQFFEGKYSDGRQQELLPVINRNEIAGDMKAFKRLSIKYFLDFSTH